MSEKKTVEQKSLEAFDELLRTLPKEEIEKMIDKVAGKSRSGFHDVNEFYKEEKEEESWDDIFLKFYGNDLWHSLYEDKEKKFFQWLHKNYNPPTKK